MSTKTNTTGKSQVGKTNTITLEGYFEHIRYSWPFSRDQVSKPSEQGVDVASIHAKEFDQLKQLAQQACQEARGIGAVLWGEAGIGKSHLLARLANWANQDENAHYIFLHNLQAGPERLARYVLKSALSSLTEARRNHFAETQLYKMLSRLMTVALQENRISPKSKPSEAELRASYERFIQTHTADEFAEIEVDDHAIYKVLLEFFLAAYWAKQNSKSESKALLALRWLEGDVLDAEEVAQLGLPAAGEQEISLPDNQAVERVLVVLTRLARYRRKPFILCFDQVEHLTAENVPAFARFCHSLIDAAGNLLLVTSGVYSDILAFVENRQIISSSWDRIGQEKIQLGRIDLTQARQLLESRLESFNDPFISIPEVKHHITSDTLFPLGRDWMDQEFAGAIELKPREVIRKARHRWRQELAILEKLGPITWIKNWPSEPHSNEENQSFDLDTLIDEVVDRKITEQIRRRELDPSTLPPDASNMCGLIERLLQQCLNVNCGYTLLRLEHPPSAVGKQPTYQLMVYEISPQGNEVRTGMVFIDAGSKTSVAGSLRRLVHDPNPPDHVLLVTEERKPLQLAARGQEYYDELLKRGQERFEHLNLTFYQYAQLDALMAVVGQAQSGDLELDLPSRESRPVSAQEVIQSHHRKDRYRKHLLLHELLTEEPKESPPSPALPRIDENDLKSFIKAQLALTQGSSSTELSHRYLSYSKFGDSITIDTVKLELERVAEGMHKDKLIQATPMEDQLFLLNRPAV